MSNHTEGPWSLSEETLGLNIIAREGKWVAEATPPADYSEDEAVANAHLITAAPELLGVVEKLIRMDDAGEDFTVFEYSGILHEARVAVAKARGVPK